MIEGSLRKNEGERWEIIRIEESRYELTSGDVVEVKIGDHWFRTRVEHNGTEYYSTVPGIRFFNGMPARVPT